MKKKKLPLKAVPDLGEKAIARLFPAIAARPYQARIVHKTLGYVQEGINSVLVESPTGSGKTLMGLMIASALQSQHGFKIGWCAMRSNLLAQAEKENVKWGLNVKMATISMFAKEPPKCDVLVVDEAQHDAANSMVHIHKQTGAKIIIALSATPFRSDRVGLCFKKIIRDAGIHQLIREGFLAKYDHYTIPKYTPEAIAETYLREPARWGKSLVFFHTQAQCDALQVLLSQAGVASSVVNATTDREAQIAAFEKGTVSVLINMMILTEGFDCPSLKTVFVRPSMKGPTIQMGGRVFRLWPEYATKQIVQCRQTRHPFQKTATPHGQYAWESQMWKSIASNENVDLVAQRTILLLIESFKDEQNLLKA